MATIFEEAFVGLQETLDQVAGVSVTLTRKVGAEERTADAVAVLGRTIFSRARRGDGGPSIEFGDGDWFIKPADYKLGADGEPVEPLDGDRIADHASGRLFEVKPVTGEPSWRWSEPEKLTYRIHSKEIQRDAP